MKLLVVAVGHKMPGWVDDAFAEYAKRLPRNFAFELTEVRPEPRETDFEMIALEVCGATWTTLPPAS